MTKKSKLFSNTPGLVVKTGLKGGCETATNPATAASTDTTPTVTTPVQTAAKPVTACPVAAG